MYSGLRHLFVGLNRLETVVVSFLYQVPVWQNVSFKGSIFEVHWRIALQNLQRAPDTDGDGILRWV